MSDAAPSASVLAFDRAGAGEPLLLLHGTGSSRGVWKPIIPLLARQREVIAIDLPGHGESPLAAGVEPTPIGYALVVAAILDRLGLQSVDVAGNSVGGWTALELAKLGRARSVVALGPAGLWPRRGPRTARVTLWLLHHAPPPPSSLLRSRLGRNVLLRRIYGRPERVPPQEALEAAAVMRSTRGFDEHLRRTTQTRFTGGQGITVPVTIAYGERERLVPKRARGQNELPEHTRWVTLPGCGHVPTWDDPELVARMILEGTAAGASALKTMDAQAAPREQE
jgi:pimeloyl-ACP methyl ester carboxylesterase